jgi:membrane protease subunit HflK
MFDRLIEFILSWLELFKFWAVIEPWEEAVLVRLGKYQRTLMPGFHWRLPLKIDDVIAQNVVPSTHAMGDESATTKDGKQIGFNSIITYKIKDIVKATLEVHDVDHAVRDACAGEICKVLHESTWSEIMESGDILDRLTAACRKRGWRWGVEIMSVQLASIALVRNIRLMQK